MRTALPAMVFALCLAAPAVQAAGSNIALDLYPGPQCAKPVRPVEPALPPDANGRSSDAPTVIGGGNSSITASAAATAYNIKVQQYNKDVAVFNAAIGDFNSCMKIYVDNGNADMQRIKQRLDQAVADANTH